MAISWVRWNPEEFPVRTTFSPDSETGLTATYSTYGSNAPYVIKALTDAAVKSAGKWYFEVYLDVVTSNCGTEIGIMPASTGVITAGNYISSTSPVNGWVLWVKWYGTNYVSHNSASTSAGSGSSAGDVIGVAYDLDAGRIWFSVNNVWVLSGDPATGANPTFSDVSVPVVPAGSFSVVNNSITGRFVSSDLVYSPPSGFSALTEPEVPEATISSTLAGVSSDIEIDVARAANLSTTLTGVTSDIQIDVARAAQLAATLAGVTGEFELDVTRAARISAALAGVTGAIDVLISIRGSIVITAPTPILQMSGTVSSNSIALTAPAPTLTMMGGGRIDLTVPLPVLAMSGTVPNVGSITLEAPEPTLALTGLVGEVGSITLTAPHPELVILGGGRVTLLAPEPVLSLSGVVPNIGSIVLEVPIPTLTINGLVGTIGSIALIAPEPTLAINGLVGTIGSIVLVAPLPTLSLYGTGITTETTYAINLTTGAVTQLLLGALDKLVTAHGRLYGLRSGALVRLYGDLDGATTIPATIRFAPQQFGTLQVKRLDGHVYLNLRENDGVTLTIVENETTSWDYQISTDTDPALNTHRVKVGRGIIFHSLGLILKNRAGGRLDVGGLELPVLPLSRRPE